MDGLDLLDAALGLQVFGNEVLGRLRRYEPREADPEKQCHHYAHFGPQPYPVYTQPPSLRSCVCHLAVASPGSMVMTDMLKKFPGCYHFIKKQQKHRDAFR